MPSIDFNTTHGEIYLCLMIMSVKSKPQNCSKTLVENYIQNFEKAGCNWE